MTKFIPFIALALALTGCDHSWRRWAGWENYPDGKSCSQPFQQMAYAENRTSQAQTVEFAYNDPLNGGARTTVSASIPAGQALVQKLRDYNQEITGSHGHDYSIDAKCNSTKETSTVDLNLTVNSFAQVKNCIVGDGSGLVYLVDTASACPEFTTQQQAPL